MIDNNAEILLTGARTKGIISSKGLMEILRDYYVIRLDFSNEKQYNEMLTWCLEHCQNKFRDLQESSGRAWYFQNEQDATMFAIKWT
jgi:hypothetical protein